MPTKTHRFPSPEPVRLRVRSGRGTVQIVASAVTETVVEVSGRHEGDQARVEASGDGRTITIDVPRHRKLGNAPRLDITVQLPEGSYLDLGTASASIDARGPVAQADVRAASGAVSIEQVTGDVDARSASGDVRLGTVGGAARLKSASGDLLVASVGGVCNAHTASGAIDVGWAGDTVGAKSASGSLTVRDAVRGALDLRTTSGDVAVGVRKGTLVWLDLTTVSGRTTSDLTPDAPSAAASEEPLTIRARTVSGDITIAPSGGSAGARGDDRRQSA
jgi:hypothetical protein